MLLTTQYLEEADQLADRLLDRGKLVAEGTADELKRLVPGGHISLRFADTSGLEAAVRALGEARRDTDELTLQLPSDGGVGALRALLDPLDAAPNNPRVGGSSPSSGIDGRRPAVYAALRLYGREARRGAFATAPAVTGAHYSGLGTPRR